MTIKHFSKTFTCDNIESFNEAMGAFDQLECTISFDYTVGELDNEHGPDIDTCNHQALVAGLENMSIDEAFAYITGRDKFTAAENIVKDILWGARQ